MIDNPNIINDAKIRFFILSCNLLTYGFNAAAKTNEANNNSKSPDILGMISNIQNREAASKLGLPVSVINDLEGFNTYPAYLYRQ